MNVTCNTIPLYAQQVHKRCVQTQLTKCIYKTRFLWFYFRFCSLKKCY